VFVKPHSKGNPGHAQRMASPQARCVASCRPSPPPSGNSVRVEAPPAGGGGKHGSPCATPMQNMIKSLRDIDSNVVAILSITHQFSFHAFKGVLPTHETSLSNRNAPQNPSPKTNSFPKNAKKI